MHISADDKIMMGLHMVEGGTGDCFAIGCTSYGSINLFRFISYLAGITRASKDEVKITFDAGKEKETSIVINSQKTAFFLKPPNIKIWKLHYVFDGVSWEEGRPKISMHSGECPAVVYWQVMKESKDEDEMLHLIMTLHWLTVGGHCVSISVNDVEGFWFDGDGEDRILGIDMRAWV
jgi:hypothetical protein